MQVTGNNFNHILSLTASIDTTGFTFFINNPNESEQISVENYRVNPSISLTANLREAFGKLDSLTGNYQAVNIMVAEPYTLMPLDQFEDEHKETIYYHNFPDMENRIVLFNVLPYANAVAIFSIDRNAHQFILEQHPHAHFFCTTGAAINHHAEQSRHSSEATMHVQLIGRATEITCFQEGRLVYANTFTEEDDADRRYFILYTWKNLGLNQQTDHLCLSGFKGDGLKKMLTEFIAHIESTEEMTTSDGGNIPHYFYSFATYGL